MRTPRLVAVLAAAVLSLAACGNSSTPESTLGEWVQQVGFMDVINGISSAIDGLATDLQAADATDLKAVAEAMAKRAPELKAQAEKLAAEAATDDAAYENLRTAAAAAIKTFAEKAAAAATATDATRVGAVTATNQALNEVSAALGALSDYITTHKADVVHAAS